MAQRSIHSTLQIGSTYTRKSIGTATGISRVGTSREGIVSVKSPSVCMLFVTLDKANKPGIYSYHDYFEGQLFHWDSQNRQNASSPLIRSIIAKEVDVHLFCRVVDKIKGITQPFVYCGLVEYHNHDAITKNPVHMIFQTTEYQSSPRPDLFNVYSWRPSKLDTATPLTAVVEANTDRSDERVEIIPGSESSIRSPLPRSSSPDSRWSSQELPSPQLEAADSEHTEPSVGVNTQGANDNDISTMGADCDPSRSILARLFQVIKDLLGLDQRSST